MFEAHGFAQSWTCACSIYIPRFKLTGPSRPWWCPVLRAQVGSCTSCSDSLSGPRVTQRCSVYHSPACLLPSQTRGTLLLTQWPPTLPVCLIRQEIKLVKTKQKLVATHSVHPEINFLFNPAPPCYYALRAAGTTWFSVWVYSSWNEGLSAQSLSSDGQNGPSLQYYMVVLSPSPDLPKALVQIFDPSSSVGIGHCCCCCC